MCVPLKRGAFPTLIIRSQGQLRLEQLGLPEHFLKLLENCLFSLQTEKEEQRNQYQNQPHLPRVASQL